MYINRATILLISLKEQS